MDQKKHEYIKYFELKKELEATQKEEENIGKQILIEDRPIVVGIAAHNKKVN